MAAGRVVLVAKAKAKKQIPKKSLNKAIKKVLDKAVEKKHVHLQNNLVPISNAGDLFHINKVGLGAEDFQRIGNKIKSLRIGIRGVIMPSTGVVAVDPYNEVRMLVIYDRQCNGAAPLLSQILTYPTDVNSPRNPDYVNRYTTLADKSFLVYNVNAQNYQGSKFRLNLKKKLTTMFGSAGNGIVDQVNGSIYCIFLSDSTLVDHPFVKYNTSYTFTDM